MTAAIPTELIALPYLTEGLPPIRAAIKRRYEDFYVQEIPAYQPCGEGDHCYITIQKEGLATLRAVNDIARHLGVLPRQIGLAGLKDARAVAVQTLSVEHVDPRRVEGLNIPRIKVLSVGRHRNKLKIGHLRGNRFVIKLREVEPGRETDLRAACDILARRGVPNYFGQQRFGLRGDTWRIGKALLLADPREAVDLVLGRPGPHDFGDVLRARQLYEQGKFAAAARAWPGGFRDQIRACRTLDKTGGRHAKAMHAIDLRMKKFYVNAYQSHLFNRLLAERLPEFDRLLPGDLAFKHDNGAVFQVHDADAEQPRAEAFEVSPTGPMFGYRMSRTAGRPGEMEERLLAHEGLALDHFRRLPAMKLHGSRRPLRFAPRDLSIEPGEDNHGPYVAISFVLPSGCYATMVLREICKEFLAEGLEEEGGGESDALKEPDRVGPV